MSDGSDPFDAPQLEQIVLLPAIEYYQKSYAKSLDNNDQKAVRLFREFESHEKLRRLQQELMWLRDGKVKESTCDRVLGKKRKGKYESYAAWGRLMLLWLVQAKR